MRFILPLVLSLPFLEATTAYNAHYNSVFGRRTFLTQAKKVAAGVFICSSVAVTATPTTTKQALAMMPLLGDEQPVVVETLATAKNKNNKEDESKSNDDPDIATGDQKAAEKLQRQQEKEARRLAEETKKRLAVGRIGTI